VLPFVLIFMLLLINKKELMGEYVNSHLFNAIAWGTTILVAGLAVALALAYIGGKAGG
jgi:Mn2+/Fe2+ NRAMP family transporter